METLVVVVVPQHRNQSRSQIKSRGFKGMMNCRSSFDSAGILPSPPPAPQPRYRSSPISITNKQAAAPKLRVARDDDELWAGPAYTNSPPPSSLPIPKFSLREKRSVSLDLSSPSSSSPPTAAHLRPVAKSAPSSPTRASTSPAGGGFLLSTAFATQDLRRILNLDI